MTPSAILLVTCIVLFLLLSGVFAFYLLRLFFKDNGRIVSSSTPAITQFSPSGKVATESLGNAMPHYQFAKAK